MERPNVLFEIKAVHTKLENAADVSSFSCENRRISTSICWDSVIPSCFTKASIALLHTFYSSDVTRSITVKVKQKVFILLSSHTHPNSMEQSPSWKPNRFLSKPRNSPHFMGPEGLLQHLQQPATCPCCEAGQPTPCPHSDSWRFSLILSS